MRKGLKASIVTLLSGVMLLGSAPVGVVADTGSKTVKSHPMYRLYNPNSGEHFYTADPKERANVIAAGWNDEGIGWYAPDIEERPVYRLYNAIGGEHHYTLKEDERDMLIDHGWNYEGIGWHSAAETEVPVYREYNPNQFACNHNFTQDKEEHDYLVSIGWKDEGIAWYASDIVKIKMYFHGSNVTDDSKVMEELNEYLTEKINVELEPVWGTWGDFDYNSVQSLQNGDDIDIYFTCSWSADEYNKFAKDGYWVRLDDPENNLLDKYGKNLKEALPDTLWQGAVTNGKEGKGIYAVPNYKDFATQYCWDVNVTKLTELGFTTDDVAKGYYEFGPILAAAKEKYGSEFYPLCFDAYTLERMVTNSVSVSGDANPNFMSYYLDPADVSKPGALGVKIVNKFATDEFRKFAKKTKEYFDLGYIDPALADAEQVYDKRWQALEAGEYVIGTQSYAFGYEKTASLERGIEVAMVPCTEPYADALSVQGAMYAVSKASENPEKAVELLDLLASDPYAMTLLTYGVEGIHYEYINDSLIQFTEERYNYSPWRNGVGNITILPATVDEAELVDDGEDFWEKFKEFYGSAKATPIFSFIFDGTEYESQMGSVGVACWYGNAFELCTGAVDDVDAAITNLVSAMNEAGAEDIINAANDQLNAELS